MQRDSDSSGATGGAGFASPDRLEALADAAIEALGVRYLAPLPRAKLVARQIGKHGGMRGLRSAAEIEAELHALGEKPWR